MVIGDIELNNDIDIKQEEYKLVLRSCFIVIDDDCILLIPHHYPDKTTWNIPGGKIQKNEDAESAALRELKEETGLDGQIIKLHSVTETNIPENKYQSYLFAFLGTIDHNQTIIAEKHKSGVVKSAEWIPLDKAISLDSNMREIISSVKDKDQGFILRNEGY